MTYEFLQSYWWFLVSLLGALLVFLMFVQGANTLIFCLGKTEEERRLIINSTGRKWEFTFTTLVTFGGAYAVLAYVAQQAVETYGWLAPGEMLDGLGMAETTPGPLIMVLQFVGFLAAYREAGWVSH